MTGVFLNSAQANLFEQYLSEKTYKVAKPYFDGVKVADDGRLYVPEQCLNILGACLKNEPLVGMYSLYVAFSEALETRKREDRERAEREQREQREHREHREREHREHREREREQAQPAPFSLTHPDNILPEIIMDSHASKVSEVQEVSEVSEVSEVPEIQETKMENVD